MRFSRFAPKKEERSRFGTIARKALSISAEDKVSEKTQQFTTAFERPADEMQQSKFKVLHYKNERILGAVKTVYEKTLNGEVLQENLMSAALAAPKNIQRNMQEAGYPNVSQEEKERFDLEYQLAIQLTGKLNQITVKN